MENQKLRKLTAFCDRNDIVMFFRFEGKIYATSEDGRIVFAKMLHPDADMSKEWVKEVSFSAYDLESVIKSSDSDENTQKSFGFKDLPKIKIISEEEAESVVK